LKSSKTLGTGSVTKRERFEEALSLEKMGKGDEETEAILFEEREVKDWKDSGIFQPEITTSAFIDHRPRSTTGVGLGFQDIPQIAKSKKKPAYNWRAKLEQEKARKHGMDIYANAESGEDDGSSSIAEEASHSSESSDEDYSEEEWTGFDDRPVEDDDNKVDVNDYQEDEEQLQDGAEDGKDEKGSEDGGEGENEEISDDEEASDENGNDNRKMRSKGETFKEWANQMMHQDEKKLETPVFQGEYKPVDRPEDREELPQEYIVPEHAPERTAYFVNIQRDEVIQLARLQLPVVSEEQRIMEAIHNNDCVVICGETGSGKTTQVPQFLFEAGYGSPSSNTPGTIGITQPRRVAAVSMAKRVASELGSYGERVAYQIRFDSTVKPDTAVKFMTDGVLLRELSNDLTLSKYSAVIIDEAHERNVNTDILIGVLSRVLKLRKELSFEKDSGVKPLKLIIMSATLRVTDFTQNSALFAIPPPVLKVEARQHPVSVHFNRRTQLKYVDEAYNKAVKVHQRLPPGGILIFLTGQNEITQVCRRLRNAFPVTKKMKSTDVEVQVRVSAKESATEVEDINFGFDEMEIQQEEDDYEKDWQEEEGFEETLEEGQDANAPLYVLPLYSLLPTKEQLKVFETPPEGSRLCVVATNVAETSLTIPGIRYVVDCGRSKERHYDEETGVQSFQISWISKASADQRSGRAGRTGPGHCYRIYSSAVYESGFPQFTKPEIMRMPIEGLVLQMKAMGIHNIMNFPFPTPPPRESLDKGLKLLKYLGAVDAKDALSDLGKAMSLFPLSPRFAKMLIIADQHGCLPYVIALVAALSVGDPFIGQQELGVDEAQFDDSDEETIAEKEQRRQIRSRYFQTQQRFASLDFKSDALKLLCAVCAYDYESNREGFCKSSFLRYKIMEEIRKLRKQVAYLVAINTRPNRVETFVKNLDAKLGPPSGVQIKALKQMIAAGFIDQIAVRADIVATDISSRSKSRVISFPYLSLFPTTASQGYLRKEDEEEDRYVYIHPNSVLAELGSTPPDYLVYASVHLSEGHKADRIAKVKMRVLTDIGSTQLSNVAQASSLITYSKPLGPPYGPKMITPTKRECWVVPRIGAAIGSGGVGWDLPAKKVVQEKEGIHWVVK
jgi:ATP-dependent RNA helicase DHX37/DHR1